MTTTPRYLALLRGINVGGKNIIKMTALKEAFASMGLGDVVTYIQSGNVLFTSESTNQKSLTEKIEKNLTEQFHYPARVVVISQTELHDIVHNAPPHFGSQPELYRYDVLFLKPPLTAREALQEVPLKEGVDTVYSGKGVLYFSRLISKATQSRLSRIVGTPLYQQLTIRNWNTTTKLLALMKR